MNISVIGVPEKEEKESGAERAYEEVITKNFPNLVTHTNLDSRSWVDPKQDQLKETHAEDREKRILK